MSADKPAGGLPIVLAATALVVLIGVVESSGGLATVADTATMVAALLLGLTVVAVVVRAASRRTTREGPRRAMTGLVAASSLLAMLVLVATYRGHTASARFDDQLADFPLPAAYTGVPATDKGPHASQPEHAVRAWQVPEGADACADVERAFRAWAEGKIQTFSRGGSCVVAGDDGTNRSEASVSDDGSTVLVERWLEGTSLFTF